MDRNADMQLEESLAFMREQFKPLSQEIKLPNSLRADLLLKRFELLEQEEQANQTPLPIQRKMIAFPVKRMVGLAACMVIVVGAFWGHSGTQQNQMSPATAQEHLDAAPEVASEPTSRLRSAEEGAEAAKMIPEPYMGDTGGAVEDAPIPYAHSEGAPPVEEPVQYATFAEARTQRGLAAYLPADLPGEVQIEEVSVFGDQVVASASGEQDAWSLSVQICTSDMAQDFENRMVDLSNPSSYDMRLYEPFTAGAYPNEQLAYTLQAPVVEAALLTPAFVEARVVELEGYYGGGFTLKVGDVLITLQTFGLKPQQVWQLAQTLPK